MKNAQTHERNIFGFTFKLNFCKKSLWANFIITTVAWNICFVKCLNYREDSFITYNLNFNYQIIQLAYWLDNIGNVNRSKLQIKINYFSTEYRSIMFHSICGFVRCLLILCQCHLNRPVIYRLDFALGSGFCSIL